MKIVKILSLIAILVFFASCKDDTTNPSDNTTLDAETGEFFPASLNTKWTYEFVQNGTTTTMTSTITGTEEYNGKTYIVAESDYNGQIQKGHMRVEDGKYYSLIKDGTTSIKGDFELLHVDENANEGDTWNIPTEVKVQGTSQTISTFYDVKLEEKLDSYEVRGNTYNDVMVMHLVLSVDYPNGFKFYMANQKYYYARGVGVIKSVSVGGGQTITQELIEFEK